MVAIPWNSESWRDVNRKMGLGWWHDVLIVILPKRCPDDYCFTFISLLVIHCTTVRKSLDLGLRSVYIWRNHIWRQLLCSTAI
jgi:hypothetical protein